MFQVGDEVVYPPYGAGYISAIEEKDFFDTKKSYHVIQFLFDELNMFVPSDLLENKNIRLAVGMEQLQEIISTLQYSDEILQFPANKRNNSLEKLLSTATIDSTIGTIQALRQKRNEEKLTQTERELYNKFFNLLVSEIMVVEKVELTEAKEMINKLLRYRKYDCH